MNRAAVRDRYELGALGVYLALSMLFFGRGLAGHFTTRLVGKNLGDPGAHTSGFLHGFRMRWRGGAIRSSPTPSGHRLG
jgi:hypothetical protein